MAKKSGGPSDGGHSSSRRYASPVGHDVIGTADSPVDDRHSIRKAMAEQHTGVLLTTKVSDTEKALRSLSMTVSHWRSEYRKDAKALRSSLGYVPDKIAGAVEEHTSLASASSPRGRGQTPSGPTPVPAVPRPATPVLPSSPSKLSALTQGAAGQVQVEALRTVFTAGGLGPLDQIFNISQKVVDLQRISLEHIRGYRADRKLRKSQEKIDAGRQRELVDAVDDVRDGIEDFSESSGRRTSALGSDIKSTLINTQSIDQVKSAALSQVFEASGLGVIDQITGLSDKLVDAERMLRTRFSESRAEAKAEAKRNKAKAAADRESARVEADAQDKELGVARDSLEQGANTLSSINALKSSTVSGIARASAEVNSGIDASVTPLVQGQDRVESGIHSITESEHRSEQALTDLTSAVTDGLSDIQAKQDDQIEATKKIDGGGGLMGALMDIIPGGRVLKRLKMFAGPAAAGAGAKALDKVVYKEGGEFIAKQGGKLALEEGGKLAGKGLLKEGGKLAGKGLLKSGLKKIPGVGLLVGGGLAAKRALDGDYTGAGLELASGAASTVPGVGTVGSVAIDAGIAARDFKTEMSKEEAKAAAGPHTSLKDLNTKSTNPIYRDGTGVMTEAERKKLFAEDPQASTVSPARASALAFASPTAGVNVPYAVKPTGDIKVASASATPVAHSTSVGRTAAKTLATEKTTRAALLASANPKPQAPTIIRQGGSGGGSNSGSNGATASRGLQVDDYGIALARLGIFNGC